MFKSSYHERHESASGRTKHRGIRATLVGALAAAGISTALATWAAGPPTVIKMIDTPMGGAFEPAKITIPSGTTVEWKNLGDTVHGASNDPALAAQKSDVSEPAGVKPFDSGFINPGETYTQTFDTPGTYKYVCSPHEMAGMKGEIIVTKQQAHK